MYAAQFAFAKKQSYEVKNAHGLLFFALGFARFARSFLLAFVCDTSGSPKNELAEFFGVIDPPSLRTVRKTASLREIARTKATLICPDTAFR